MKQKMTRKAISILICLIMLLTMLPVTPASAAAVSGTTGSASWTLVDGLLTISGGEMGNYASPEEQPWHSYAPLVTKVVIGAGVTRVGDYAFSGCTNLAQVKIGSSVTTIGAYAFEGTTSLVEAVMPKNVKVFCEGMFHDSGLKKLYVYSRYTSFDGFYSVDPEGDDVLPLDTVIYCYDCSHAYFYFNRDTVILTDDMALDVDNGDSTISMDPNENDFVRDLWKAADSADGLVFDYTISMNTDDITRIHNELVADGRQIGPEYHNDGKLEVEVQISLRDEHSSIATIWAGADYSFFEYDMKYRPNDNYGTWGCYSNHEQFVTVTGDSQGVTVRIDTNMQELEAFAGEPIDEVFIYVSAKGKSYKYNYSYGFEYEDKVTTVESASVSIYDAHLRDSFVEAADMLTLDYKLTVEDFPVNYGTLSAAEYANYYEPVSRRYVWDYAISREGYFYNEETDESIYPGDCFWEMEGDGIATEIYDGVLYGGVRGSYDAGSNSTVTLRDMLPADQRAFVETLKGVEPTGSGGETRIELNYTLYITFADGSEIVLQGGVGDETSMIAGICLHSCTVCSLCTSAETLSCNSRYGWRTNECTCDVPSPAIVSSSLTGAAIVDEKSFCYQGDVTAKVETFDVEMAVTTDYYKAVTKNLASQDVLAVYDITLYNEWGDAITINEWGGTDEYITIRIPVSAEIAEAAASGLLELYHVDKNGITSLVPITADTYANTLTFKGYHFSPYVLIEKPVGIYYGRAQLAKMANSAALLHAYDQIAAGVDACSASITIYNGESYLTPDDFAAVMDAYLGDYTHHFWFGNEWSYSTNGFGITAIYPSYVMTGSALEAARAAFQAEAAEILSGITPAMSDYEKELYIHDALAARIVYEDVENAHNAYGALVGGKAVCEGYAEAFQYLLQQADVPSFIITGTSRGQNHAWNAVKIDGKWYHVDLTWNDQDDELFHAYFNITSGRISEDHLIGGAAIPLPSCTSEDAFYFTGKDTLLNTYDAATVAKLLKDNGGKVHVYIPGDAAAFIQWYMDNIMDIIEEAGPTGSITYGYGGLGHEVILIMTGLESCVHNYKSQVTKPTCTEDGFTTYTCTLCDHSYVDDHIPATGHNEVTIPGAAPGCEATGLTEGKRCTVCDTVTQEQDVIPATGHNEEAIPGIAPDCENTGLTEGKKCTVCGIVIKEQTEIPATGHNEVTIPGAAPDCENTGLTEGKKCTVCGIVTKEQTEIPATGHSEEIIPGTEPGCETTGLTEGKKCTVCGVITKEQTEIPAAGHSEEIIPGTEPGCETTGLTEGKKCTTCGIVTLDQIEVPALGHDYKSVVTKPTCTEDGFTTYTCTRCDHSYADDQVPATGHNEEPIPGVAPGCETTGLTEGKKCTVCGTVTLTQDVIPAAGHSEESIPAVAPGCETTGLTEGKKCTVCGTVTLEQTEVPATGHSWEDGICGNCSTVCHHTYGDNGVCTICGFGCAHSYDAAVTAPTCTTDGYTTYTCITCGHTYNGDYTAALDHSWTDATCTEPKTCTVCGITEGNPGGHSHNAVVTPPTCTEDGYTTYTCHCGDTYTGDPTSKLGHSMGQWETTKAANCTEEGSRRRDCIRCDHYETEALPALGHQHEAVVTAPTCTEDGFTTYTCHCGDTYTGDPTSKLGHDMGPWTVVIEPTPSSSGKETRTCTRCDYSESRETEYAENVLKLEGEELQSQTTVWINGLPYAVRGEGDNRYVELPTADDCYMVTYTFHVGDVSDVHTQYPTGMKVYKISGGKATHIPEFDNLLQYSGASIRITGKKGIRMITSLDKATKDALIGKGLSGYTLEEYGTVLAFAHEMQADGDLVLGKPYSRFAYAYKREKADPVFAYSGNLIQYTNVMTDFTLDQCKEDIAMRPYITLSDADGNQITLYGGTVYRSIGYIAYQNRSVFTPNTAPYNYVWEIINHAYTPTEPDPDPSEPDPGPSEPEPDPSEPKPPQSESLLHSGIREDGTFTSGAIFIGDSLTYGLVNNYLKGHNLLGDAYYMAIPGATPAAYFYGPAMRSNSSTFSDYSDRFEGMIMSEGIESVGSELSAVYFMMGTNYSSAVNVDLYIQIINHLLEHCPNATIYLQRVPYETSNLVNGAAANERIRKAYEYFAERGEPRLKLVETDVAIGYHQTTDGIHLTEKGQRFWYEELVRYAKDNNIPQ